MTNAHNGVLNRFTSPAVLMEVVIDCASGTPLVQVDALKLAVACLQLRAATCFRQYNKLTVRKLNHCSSLQS